MNNSAQHTPEEILDFWFNKISPKQWWAESEIFDQQIKSRFGALHSKAACCELYDWRKTIQGILAEIIILDQFSRNIYRKQPQAFACDALALTLAQTAVANGVDHELNSTQKAFLYMPYMHSESPTIHNIAVSLFRQQGMEQNLDFELQHKAIIDRFGRYPHRNEALGRVSTAEEIDFLKTPRSSF